MSKKEGERQEGEEENRQSDQFTCCFLGDFI